MVADCKPAAKYEASVTGAELSTLESVVSNHFVPDEMIASVVPTAEPESPLAGPVISSPPETTHCNADGADLADQPG